MNRLQRFRRRVYSRIPLWIRERDFELFVSTLCVTAGVPLLISDVVDATSIEATLPPVLVKVWAIMLAVAPFAIAVGLFMRYRLPMAQATFWMRVEAWGLRALAYVAYIYSIATVLANSYATLPATMIIFVFAATCHSRATGVTIDVEDYLENLGTPHAK